MNLVTNAQKRLRPHPFLYRVFTYIYVVLGEVTFFFHALFAGKLLSRLRGDPFPRLISKQTIVSYLLRDVPCNTNDDFRKWLKKESFQFQEGRWTFYIPPQPALQNHFGFVSQCYPRDAGLKILKDFRHPDRARYTRHMQSPAPGAALKRLLTPSLKTLVRGANYLYLHGLGVRLYDLVALEGLDRTLSAYVVEHVQGNAVTLQQYEMFMSQIRRLLARNEIMTVHESVDIMLDFAPPNCSGNLVMSSNAGRALYVDFQGFLFRNEKKFIQSGFEEVSERTQLRGGRSFIEDGKGEIDSRWLSILEMMKAAGLSFSGRVAYEVACNIGLSLYCALSEGAQWAIGWDYPEVVASANRVLLGLGATRFDLFGREMGEETEFKSDIPERFGSEARGVLFYSTGGHERLPLGVSRIPWEYMILEGQGGDAYEEWLKGLDHLPWLRNSEVLTHRSYQDGDSQARMVILLRRQH